MKKGLGFLLIIISIFVISFVLSASVEDSLHLNIQVTNSSNNDSILTGTFSFTFNISTSANCNNVVYTNSSTLTTDSRGVISYYLANTNLNYSDQYWLCYYRNSILINASKIAQVPYAFRAKNVTLSGVDIDTNLVMGIYNITAGIGNFGAGLSVSGYRLNVVGSVNITENVTSSKLVSTQICLNGDCRGAWPTGGTGGSGIIESGNNSNGYYVKFADGTMIQWGIGIWAGSISSTTVNQPAPATVTWYHSASQNQTFPVPFIDTTTSITWSSGQGSYPVTYYTHTVTTTQFSYYISTLYPGDSMSTGIKWHAIGRWTTLTNITQNTTSWAVNSNGDTVLFDTTKKVGIGTTSPSTVLDVQGINNAEHLRLSNTGSSQNFISFLDQSINMSRTDTSTAVFNIITNNFGVWGSNGGAIVFSPNNTERMRITSAGNVGIGTTSPTSPLTITTASAHTIPTLNITFNPSNPGCFACTNIGQRIDVLDAAGSGKINIGLWVKSANAATNYAAIFESGNVGIGTSSPVGVLHINTPDTTKNLVFSRTGLITNFSFSISNNGVVDILQLLNSSATGGMYMDANGKIGIGTASPTSKLDVAGDVNISGSYLVGGIHLTTTYYIRSNNASTKCLSTDYAPAGYTDADCTWIWSPMGIYQSATDDTFQYYTTSACTTLSGRPYGMSDLQHCDKVGGNSCYVYIAPNSGFETVMQCIKGNVETDLTV